MLEIKNAFVTGQNLIDLVKKLNDKNAEQAILLYSDINNNAAKITLETTRATTEEARLAQMITDQATKNTSDLKDMETKLSNAVTTLESKHNEDKAALNLSIDQEKSDRQAAINYTYQTLSTTITNLDTAINNVNDGSIVRQINTLNGQLRTYIDNQDEAVQANIDSEVAKRQALETNYLGFTDAINARVTAEIAQVNANIDSHISQFSSLATSTQAHIASEANPHKVTAEQIGAATTTALNSLQNTVSTNYSNSLRNSGDEKLIGSLTIAKDSTNSNGQLTIEGDLIVNGSTITNIRETKLLEDNFLLLNSNDNSLAAPAGIAVRLGDNTAAAIAYNPATNDFSLGTGTIDIENDFTFDQSASRQILTTQTALEDKHLLVWDATSNNVIDGGTYDPDALKNLFVSQEAHNAAVENIGVNGAAIATLNINKQDKQDSTLTTTAKTVVGGINELQTNHQGHVNSTNNPHNVTWFQIIDQDLTFTGQDPVMDGEAFSGVSDYAARYDHRHPTDTNRAPVNHASATQDYGVATESNYGHVKFDLEITETSENPVPGKVVFNHTADLIKSLKFDAKELAASETISKISQANGVISVDTQAIQIAQSQVTGLGDALKANETAIANEESARETADEALERSIDELSSTLDTQATAIQALSASLDARISEEAATRTSSDAALQSALNTQIGGVTTSLEETNNKLNEVSSITSILETLSTSLQNVITKINAGTLDPSQGFMLTFTQNSTDTSKWDTGLMTFDEGELDE